MKHTMAVVITSLIMVLWLLILVLSISHGLWIAVAAQLITSIYPSYLYYECAQEWGWDWIFKWWD